MDEAERSKALIDFALPINIANMEKDLGKYRIAYDVWFRSPLHASGACRLVDKLASGACYKAEDGAIMYRSAQYAAKYGTVNKKKDRGRQRGRGQGRGAGARQRHSYLLCRRHCLPLQ